MNEEVLKAARALVSEQNSQNGKKRWQGVPKKKRSEHMRSLAIKRHSGKKK